MSHLALMMELAPFKGKKAYTCIGDITEIAKAHGMRVNIIDKVFNPSSIDDDP